MSCVHYAHAGSGEIHLQPIINLKTKEGKNCIKISPDWKVSINPMQFIFLKI